MTATNSAPSLLLGIETGGSHTVALLADTAGHLHHRIEAGPANLRLLSDAQLHRHLREIAQALPRPTALGIGLPGLRTAADRARVRAAVGKVWGQLPCWIGNDLETALAAEPAGTETKARILVLSGTGSCCFGLNHAGQSAKVGGWGHLLGDQGSGFDIAMRALRRLPVAFDHTGRWPRLGEQILRVLLLNEPDDLITFVQHAAKPEVARLAPLVFTAWHRRDRLAAEIIQQAAAELVQAAVACARRLAETRKPVHFVFAGSALLRQPKFAALVRAGLLRSRPGSRVSNLVRESVWGAVEQASIALKTAGPSALRPGRNQQPRPQTAPFIPTATRLSPTEERNPRSLGLDQLTIREAVRLMITEDRRISTALLREERAISRAIGLIERSLRSGGRLFYVGAGTSGRLGVLDASECPPTFRTSPDLVQGIIAGGAAALYQAAEGAEDDFAAGRRALEYRGVTHRDVVVGIAASGRTPFVWGALQSARTHGAKTVLVCFNPHLRFERGTRPEVVIAPRIGPEILTGSTRLKAGTATKLILNLFTTITLVRLGKVVSNLMVDVNPSNVKLRDRAVRIVSQLTGTEEPAARRVLEQSGWTVKAALKRLARTGRRRRGPARRKTAATQKSAASAAR